MLIVSTNNAFVSDAIGNIFPHTYDDPSDDLILIL